MNLLFDFDVMNLLFKNNGGRERRPNIVVLCSMECFQCRRLVGGGLGQRFLYRAGWGRDSCIGPVDILSLCS